MHEEPVTHAFGKTYTFGPTFRAENSNTSRHAAEFWMMEPEICFCNLDELMDHEEEMIKYEIAEELGLLDRVLADGWRSLSSKETGRIGGLLARRKREEVKK